MSFGKTRHRPVMLSLISLALLLQASSVTGRKVPSSPPPDPRPNVVVIVADDLGYADLSAQGATDIATPSIDRIFHEGVQFTSGYMSAALCSPSRAGLLTGRYQERFGHDFNPGDVKDNKATIGLPTGTPTLAELLRARGYATALIGKWHLGQRPDSRPTTRGFDEFFGFLGQEHWYTRDKFTHSFEPLLRGDTPVTDTTYLTRAFAREAVSFLQRNATRPFFLYLAFNAVHVPMQEDPATMSRVAGITDATRRRYASMVTSLDDGVGEVLAALDRLKLARNTLVVFVSDNGGPSRRTMASNGPLNGAKASFLEGGIRVPFAMRWPARLPSGATFSSPVSGLDLTPTALAAAGGDVGSGRFDGVDLLPFIVGQDKGTAPHQRLYWRMGYTYAVRDGHWKLVTTGAFGRGHLYDVEHDAGETKPVERSHPEVVKRLEGEFREWNAGMARPSVFLPGILGQMQQWYHNRKASE